MPTTFWMLPGRKASPWSSLMTSWTVSHQQQLLQVASLSLDWLWLRYIVLHPEPWTGTCIWLHQVKWQQTILLPSLKPVSYFMWRWRILDTTNSQQVICVNLLWKPPCDFNIGFALAFTGSMIRASLWCNTTLHHESLGHGNKLSANGGRAV